MVVGAVTDGSANPMLMVFSLMPLFDFTASWEDDVDKVQTIEEFKELSSVDETDSLSWIYRLALEKGRKMSMLTDEIKKNSDKDSDEIEWIWGELFFRLFFLIELFLF